MFDDKNRKDDLSPDELELMNLIEAYEHEEVQRTSFDQSEDTAFDSHDPIAEAFDQPKDKTLTIMSVGKEPQETSVYPTRYLDFSDLDVGAADDDDPRFELHRRKDKKPKQHHDKKPVQNKKDEKLDRTVLMTIVIASIIAVIAGGFLIYNSFLRDRKANDDNVTEVMKQPEKKKPTTKTDKKQQAAKKTDTKQEPEQKANPDKESTTDNQEQPKEPPKADHSADIAYLQGLIDQERTNYNNLMNQANTLQEQLNTYQTSYKTLQDHVTAAQAAIDAAGDQVTDEQQAALQEALQTATNQLTDFLNQNPNPPTQQQIDAVMSQAQASLNQIDKYQNQISQYQNN